MSEKGLKRLFQFKKGKVLVSEEELTNVVTFTSLQKWQSASERGRIN